MQGLRKLLAIIFLAHAPVPAFAFSAFYPDSFPPNGIPYLMGSLFGDFLQIQPGAAAMNTSSGPATVIMPWSNIYNQIYWVGAGNTNITNTGGQPAILISGSGTNNGTSTSGNTVTIPGNAQVYSTAGAAIRVSGSGNIINCAGKMGIAGGIYAYFQDSGSNTVNLTGTGFALLDMVALAGSLNVTLSDAASCRSIDSSAVTTVINNSSNFNIGNLNLNASGSRYEANNNSYFTGNGLIGPNSVMVFNSTNTLFGPFTGTIQVGSGSDVLYYRGILTNPITVPSGNSRFLPQARVSFTQNQTFTGMNVTTPLGLITDPLYNGKYSTTYTQNGVSNNVTNFNIQDYSLYVINSGFSLASTGTGTLSPNGWLMIKGSMTQPPGFATTNTGTTILSGTGSTIVGAYSGTKSLYIGVPSSLAASFPGSASSNYSSSGNITGFALIQIDSPSGGSIFTLNNNIAGAAGSSTLNVAANNTMIMATGATVSSLATAFNLDGTVNFNSATTGATAMPFLAALNINSTGVLNVNENLVRSGGPTTLAGAINIASGKTFTFQSGFTQTAGSVAGAGALVNTSTYNMNGGTFTAAIRNNTPGVFNLAATMTPAAGSQNTGVFNIASLGVLTLNSAFTNSGTMNNSGTMSVNANLLGAGTLNNSNVLNLTNVVNANAINNSGTANIFTALSGTGVFTNNNIANVTAATLSQTSTLVNNSIMYFNGANILSGPTTNTGTMFLNPNASLTVTGNGTIPAGTIAATANTNTTFTVDKDFSFAGQMNNVQNIVINAGTGIMRLQNGASVTGFNDFAINGDLVIESGAMLSINPGDNFHGNGNLDNFGQLNINGSNLTLGGYFYNHSSGVFSIYGVPTLNFGGAFTNDGSLITTFNESNSLPIINVGLPPTLANGTIAIGYTGNYIANGFYPFINGPAPIPLNSIGAALLPQTNIYITNWALGTQGNTVGVQVTRRGFGDVATIPEAKQIGYYLDSLGENNPSQDILNLLNGLQKITNPTELDAALIEILPPDNVPMQTLANVNLGFTAVQDHIFALACRNNMFNQCDIAAGDASVSNGVWIRPFGDSARQNTKGSLIGYTARTTGVVGGFDNQVSSNLLLGIGGSYAKSTVTQQYSLSSKSTIKSYNVLLYSSYKTEGAAYIDGVISLGTNSFEGSRVMDFTSFYSVANSKYSGQQYTAKIMASKNYRTLKYFQFTPMALAQYGFLRQLPYTETGAGAFNRNVAPNNMNLFQLGVGSQLSMPFDEGKIMGIPAIYAMVLVDAQGGELVTNTQFISGGPILTNNVQAGRLIGRLGMSVSYQLGDNVEVVGNYNIEVRSKYFANELFLNMRYVF